MATMQGVVLPGNRRVEIRSFPVPEPGDRVVVYHIAGCGLCADCRGGRQISCSRPERAAYGWQRDGGRADYLPAEERTLVTHRFTLDQAREAYELFDGGQTGNVAIVWP